MYVRSRLLCPPSSALTDLFGCADHLIVKVNVQVYEQKEERIQSTVLVAQRRQSRHFITSLSRFLAFERVWGCVFLVE